MSRYNQPAASKLLLLLTFTSALINLVSSVEKNINRQQIASQRQVRHSSTEKDFAPRLVHQPEGAQVKPNEPHTVECAVEAKPAAEVSWFKDDQLLVSRPPHQEQTGGDLMFFQMSDEDTGEYHCQASNYLGRVSSARFSLVVQSSRHDPRIRLEPRLAEAEPDKQVRFTCSLPQEAQGEAQEVSWRRNGRRLQAKWLEEEEELSEARSRFVARRLSPSEFVLLITRVQLKDDNATFTCLLSHQDDSLPSESGPVRLRVRETTRPVEIEPVNLGKPIDNLANSKDPSLLAPDNRTTLLIEPRRVSSLRETLRDLYEMAKPTLMILAIVSIVGALLLLQLVYIRRRTRQNRYMKHQYSGGSSGASSALGGASIDCGDPVLNSLMGRTLSAPAAAKKYRSYRDHMRKVAAANELVAGDLVDNYFAAVAQQQHQDREPFFSQQLPAAHLPNLYNQSLAAREQHRSLLQQHQSEHMRSLSNLQQSAGIKQQALRLGLNGSHLNLPLSFAFGTSNDLVHNQANNSLWPPHLAALPRNQQLHFNNNQNQQRQPDEHYQLVNCSSLSPSSSSSSTAAEGESASSHQHQVDHLKHLQQSSVNHYSTIDNNEEEEEEDRYEELDHRQQNKQLRAAKESRGSRRTSTFVTGVESQQLDQQLRSSLVSSSTSSNCADSSSSDTFSRFGSKRNSSSQRKSLTSKRQASQQQDHLSPYAVSSICGSIAVQPPPVNSEAMKALNEQFDINQLMLLDESPTLTPASPQLPFETPPPPPPPPPPANRSSPSDDMDKKRSRQDN